MSDKNIVMGPLVTGGRVFGYEYFQIETLTL